ncbi:DsbE family thiol:disulfide interchange protein [Marinomonas mediterranea]|uniref:Periplasmic protein thiol/disulfide oxidoreductase DsbE n=1 Tax=Marinomonas mediterranea (strain ATCC 700492 / JCM 21426 / NBRC 103028 / MMB-1) TaxID=717774 RepID=F2K3H7_MARM1|nr:DsbE family thiol:disulfide interchange protein [Marinomonas mediterranea]ADZ92416.1 periplasmic protein thiol/disulfide oxidoreductase DsbE [Marinomonas mediterranea MMB-1]WCN18465.1 DsbE family thiol:disulfide interchange protein [Marinomonas mediterranea MMB-1]
MKKALFFIPFLVLIFLGSFFYFNLDNNHEQMPSALIGKAAPEFKLIDLETNEVMTQDQLPKGPYLINVWGTWCPACAQEHEYLMTLAERGVNIVGVDYKDEMKPALAWLEQRGNPYSTVIFDEMGSLGVDLGVTGAPETFVVNRDGVIVYRHQGVVNEDVWQSLKTFVE